MVLLDAQQFAIERDTAHGNSLHPENLVRARILENGPRCTLLWCELQGFQVFLHLFRSTCVRRVKAVSGTPIAERESQGQGAFF